MKSANLPIVLLVILSAAIFSAAQVKSEESTVVRENVTAAQNLLKTGDAAAAIKVLQATLQSNPQNETVKFWLGKIFYSQGNYQKTIEALNFSVDKLPKNSAEQMQTVQMLGLSHYILGHLAEAIPNFEKLTQWQPENSEIAYALGVCYIQTRQPDKSRQTFAKLFNVPIGSASAYLLNAKMQMRQQFEEAAEIELKKASGTRSETSRCAVCVGRTGDLSRGN